MDQYNVIESPEIDPHMPIDLLQRHQDNSIELEISSIYVAWTNMHACACVYKWMLTLTTQQTTKNQNHKYNCKS